MLAYVIAAAVLVPVSHDLKAEGVNEAPLHLNATRITIHSVHSGWGDSEGSTEISKSGTRYISGGRPVPLESVRALTSALSASPINAPDSKNLGVDRDWVSIHSQELTEQLTPKQREFAVAKMRQPGVSNYGIRSYYEGFHTDDSSEVEVKVESPRGREPPGCRA